MKHSSDNAELLGDLATKVRAFAHQQLVASPWFRAAASPSEAVCARMHQLQRAGLITAKSLLVEPLFQPVAPVFVWSPGDADPDFSSIAWKLQSRWPALPALPTTAYFTTVKANRVYGGPRSQKRIRIEHELHDLSLASVYLHYVEHDPQAAAAWIGEDLLDTSGFRMCDVDAVLRYDDGRPERVIEFGGRYDVRRVEHFHRDCVKRERPYDLW